ncbi:MAG: HD domain-containing protein [Nitrososphaerales archaeon]
MAEIRDPIHGYIHITEVERSIIDTPIFQRLRRIKQLAGAYLTYPGGQHSRFEHSIGVMHLIDFATKVLINKGYLDKEKLQELRLAALLHDIGHGPFSHLIEEVMTEKRGITHEDITQRILRETEIKEILEKYGFNTDYMADLTVARCNKCSPFMNDLLGGGLSVDIMDYLLRDSYFTGVEYGKVDVHRIINSFEVVNDHLALDYAALYAFEALMIARYEMFRAVYFHRTVRAAEIMLINAIDLADDELGLTDTSNLDKYLSLTDEQVLTMLTNLNVQGRKDLKRAKDFAIGYRDRKLLKCVFERLIHRKDKFMERLFTQKRIRERIAAEIAEKAGVDADNVFVDVPTTPSIPYTSAREVLTSITLVSKTIEGIKYQTIPLSDLPLVSSITGYMDILRVYTPVEHRVKVEKAAREFFGKEGYSTKVSM